MSRWNNPNCGFQKGHKTNIGHHFKRTEKNKDQVRKIILKKWQEPEYRKHMSEVRKGKGYFQKIARKGKQLNTGRTHFKKGFIPWNKGKHTGIIPWNYKGMTPINKMIRGSIEFLNWRKQVFERDDFTCQMCSKRGKIHANHIKKFADYPESRFDINNGITLCVKCHMGIVTRHETEWESYFNFNLMTRGFIEDEW